MLQITRHVIYKVQKSRKMSHRRKGHYELNVGELNSKLLMLLIYIFCTICEKIKLNTPI